MLGTGPSFRLVVLLGLAVIVAGHGAAQSDQDTPVTTSEHKAWKDPETPVVVRGPHDTWATMGTLTVLLQDEAGSPVEHGWVMPYAMRMRETTGHGYWNDELLGARRYYQTDANGRANIPYPIELHRDGETLTTKLLTFDVQHSDFVTQTVHFDLGPDAARVTLKPGSGLVVSATDKSGGPIGRFGVVMAGPELTSIWSQPEPGVRRCRSIPNGQWQTLLVQTNRDGRHLFSDIFEVPFRKEQTVNFRGIRLEPGARVNGTLSNNVPRPVRRGYIIATSVPSPAEDFWDEENPSLCWRAWEEIDKNGRFCLQSIPRGGQLQIIAICEGWLSTTTVHDAGGRVMGQLIDISSQTVAVEVAMEPTGSIELEINKQDGTPLDSGSVSSWPNQRNFKGGSSLLGTRFQTSRRIESQQRSPERPVSVYRSINKAELPFLDREVRDGNVKLSGLPVGPTLQLALSHPEMRFSGDSVDEQGRIRIQLDSPNVKRIKTTAK